MDTSTILIISAIASAFTLFGVVLAWGDFYSRRPPHRQASETLQAVFPPSTPASEHREAA